MIQIVVHYRAQARVAAGVAEETVELEAGCTPADVIVRVAQRGENLKRLLLDAEQRPHPSLLVFVGGEQISVNAPQPLKNGDVLEILPPMSGG